MSERCAALRCVDDALPNEMLCDIHQARLDRGHGLPTRDDPTRGEPSGYGIFGELDIDDAGILCNECGARLASLSQHLRRTHNLQVGVYRSRHGLLDTTSLVVPADPDGKPRRRPHPCSRCGAHTFGKKELCSDCGEQFWAERERRRIERQQPRPPRWRDLTDQEREALSSTVGDDLEALVRGLQLTRVRSRDIGEVIGLSPERMSVRYPRPGRAGQPRD